MMMTTSSTERRIEDIYPLAPMQQGMLFHTLLEPDQGYYIEQVAVLIEGEFNEKAFVHSWEEVVSRHTILRTAFVWEDVDQPLQIVYHHVELPFRYEDWRNVSTDEQEKRLESLLNEDKQQPFDLGNPPLMRFIIIQLTENSRRFIWSHHHILLDGWSTPIIFKEVFLLYESYLQGEKPSLPKPRPFREYIAWLQKQDKKEAEKFWREELIGVDEPTPLVFDTLPGNKSKNDLFHPLVIRQLSKDASYSLREFAQKNGLTLNTILQGIWAILYNRYSGQDDVIFGATVSGRPPEIIGSESMVGLFINTIPIRIKIKPGVTLINWFKEIQAKNAKIRQYEYTPLFSIQKLTNVPNNLSLFETIFVFENFPVEPTILEQQGSFKIRDVRHSASTNYPLTYISAPGQVIEVHISYDPKRIAASVINRLLAHLCTLLEQVPENGDRFLSSLHLFSNNEVEKVLSFSQGQKLISLFPGCIHQLFEKQVDRTPDAVALLIDNNSVTYNELDQKSNQIAHLLNDLGVVKESKVGICLNRSIELVSGILGVLKAGGAYVPLDPNLPLDRFAYIFEDCGIELLITQQSVIGNLPIFKGKVICLDQDASLINRQSSERLNLSTTPNQLAYIIYTSGSTGIPKGVAVEHHSLVNHAQTAAYHFEMKPGIRMLHIMSLSFDASAEEIYPTLTHGGTIVLAPGDQDFTAPSLLSFIEKNKVNILHLPVAVWHQLVSDMELNHLQVPDSLKVLLVGGEQPSIERLRSWLASSATGIKFINAYGPTEATIATTYFVLECSKEKSIPSDLLPIGKPINNVEAYVLDKYQNLLPIGLPGELFIGGEGLAREYLNRAELTSEKFIFTNDGKRLYKTGDRVVWNEDGNLVFLGRIDEQVKWRGYRIELGEVETQIMKFPGICENAVLLREDQPGEKRLVAYLVPKDSNTFILQDLKNSLKGWLPDYMLPTQYVILDALPMTPTGKINRRALPVPELERPDLISKYIPPRNATQEIIVNSMASVLGLERVGIFDNFFDLGGHSLLATQLVSRLRSIFHIDLSLKEIFDDPTATGIEKNLLIHKEKDDVVTIPPLSVIPRNQELPLSFAQQRLWFLDQLEPGNLFYNIPSAVRIEGKLIENLIQEAFKQVIKRHESLRTIFSIQDGRPVQIINSDDNNEIIRIDLSHLPDKDKAAEAKKLVDEEAKIPFNLGKGPLIRAKLLKLSKDEYVLLFTVHHIIADGWSMGILVRELVSIYQSLVEGSPINLPPLPYQYVDYSAWQRAWLQGENLERQVKYWKERLKGAPALLQLPTDKPRPAIKTPNGEVASFSLDTVISEKIYQLCRQEGVTLYMFLLAAFQTLLYRYSGQEDVLVGTAVANRTIPEIENLIGFFVNTLVMRTDFSGVPNFRDLLAQVREHTLDAYSHQDLPFEMLVDVLQPERNLSYTPLFQVGFDVQTAAFDYIQTLDLKITPISVHSGTTAFDLLFSITQTQEGLLGSMEYSSDLFNRETIIRLLENFKVLLKGVLDDPDLSPADLPILSDNELQLVKFDWNRTSLDTGYEQCIHHRFETWVERQPDHIAVTFEDQTLTYQDLNRKANKLARFLKSQGVTSEDIIGVYVDRSLEMVIGILAILKSGGAYLPLDPNYPDDRINYMIEDVSRSLRSHKMIILTHKGLSKKIENIGENVISIDLGQVDNIEESDQNLGTTSKPANLAYVIYTSGSTGRPKGTLLMHRGLCNLSESQRMAFEITPESRILQFSPLSFDASVWEVFMALGNGARLCLAKQESLASGLELLRLLREQEITTVTLPPSMLAVLPYESLPDLKTIIAAGEACSQEIVDRWAPGRKFFNAYGPTETTVCATMSLCHEGDPLGPSIGKPLPNFQVFIADKNLHLVPIGVPGELLVAGIGLARGYLNQPELTSEKFIPNPFSRSGRLYRTGDLVRYRSDGNIEFLGRIDQQVKVRGFRIELGEIETVLKQIPYIADAVVIVREDNPGDKRIIAYLVLEKGEINTSKDIQIPEIRQHLREKLPEYMVPSNFVIMEEFPITPSGKIDRKALPAPENSRIELSVEYVAPRNPIETDLVDICINLLKLDKVGVNDNFFEIGGHSLLATQFISRVRDRLSVELPLRALFEHPTIAELAIEIEIIRQRSKEVPQAPAIQAISRESRKRKITDLDQRKN